MKVYSHRKVCRVVKGGNYAQSCPLTENPGWRIEILSPALAKTQTIRVTENYAQKK